MACLFPMTHSPIRCWSWWDDLVRFVGKPTIAGQWRYEGHVYRDESVGVFVDVPDTQEDRQFFIAFKETLKQRFQQIDIWMTTFPLEVI